MWFTRLALKRPVTVCMIFLCAVVTGLAATRLLPLELFPAVQFPGVGIQVNYPGSTPEEVERAITRPLEEALATIDGVMRMQSTSTDNQASVFLQFPWSEDTKLKSVEAREKVDNIRHQLPDDIRRIFVFTGNTSDEPVMQLRISSNTDLADSWQVLNRQLKQRLERIPGVARVDIYGVAPKSYQIRLRPESIAAYNIDTNALLQKLQNTNALVAAGEIKNDNRNLRVTVNQQFDNETAMADFVVNARGVRLGDIADIKLGTEELTGGRHLNREFAVGLNITKEAGANLVETAEAVEAELAEIETLADFDGIDIFIITNSADDVLTSLRELTIAGSIGFLLSFIVLLAFLRDFRLTMIVSLAVPFSLMITLAVIYLTGFTLNILSMMGLMLAIGMLVDNAVVISESIFTHRSKPDTSPVQASIRGVKDVGVPVVAGTLTTAIVFLPNIIGEKIDLTIFLSHVAISIVVALAASLFLATTIIPLLLSRVPIKLKDTGTDSSGGYRYGRYTRFLRWLLQRPAVGGLVALGLAVAVMIPAPFVKMDLLGSNQNNELEVIYNVTGTHELERVEAMVTRMEDFLFEHNDEIDLEDVYSYFEPNFASSQLLLKPDEQRSKTLEEIRTYIEERMPKFAIARPGFERIRGGENGFVLRLYGEDSATLWRIYDEVAPPLENLDDVVQVRPLVSIGRQEVVIDLNAQRIQQLGLTPEAVAQTIGTALRKRQLRTYRDEHGETDISVSLFEGNQRATMDQLAALPISFGDNRQARLDSMAEFSVQRSLPPVRRTNRQSGIGMRLEYRKDATSQEVREAVNQVIEQISLPTGYHFNYGQRLQQGQQQVNVMLINMLLAIMMIFIVMAALFESLLFPFAAISSIFYGIVGVFWFYFFTGTSMTIMGMIGVLVLMGVVVNNAIVLIDRINSYRKQGIERIDAILRATNDRIRPIMMTVATTILGLLPLSMGDTTIGAGGPPYFPMARAVIGGLAYSTLATLICLPVIYLALDKTRHFYGGLWRASAQRGTRFDLRKMKVVAGGD